METQENAVNDVNVDDKIRAFMARKSPLRTLSKVIAEKFSRTVSPKSQKADISYERTEWHSDLVAHSH